MYTVQGKYTNKCTACTNFRVVFFGLTYKTQAQAQPKQKETGSQGVLDNCYAFGTFIHVPL